MRDIGQSEGDESASRFCFMRVFFEFKCGLRYCFDLDRVTGGLGTGVGCTASYLEGSSSSSSVFDAEGLLLIWLQSLSGLLLRIAQQDGLDRAIGKKKTSCKRINSVTRRGD